MWSGEIILAPTSWVLWGFNMIKCPYYWTVRRSNQSILKEINPEHSLKVKVTQSCLTLCNPMDCTVYGVLQARILEWVAFPFSRASSQPRDWTQVSCIAGGFFTSWATREAPFIEGTDAKTEAPILWLPDTKNQLIGKDSNAGKDWRQKEKRATEDKMVR